MANKKTTLKTQTGDNVYPNVLKENLPASTIFYGDEAAGPEGGVETPSGGESVNDLPVVELTDETTEVSDAAVKQKILANINDNKYLICKLRLAGTLSIEVLITRDTKVISDDNTLSIYSVLSQIEMGIGNETVNFILVIDENTILAKYKTFDYTKNSDISLVENDVKSTGLGITTSWGDSYSINGNTFYFDTINGEKIYHQSDTDIVNHTIPEPSKAVPLYGNHNVLVPADSTDTAILPCTAADNGKVLSVVEGQAQWATPTGGGVNGLEADAEGNLTASKNLKVSGNLEIDGSIINKIYKGNNNPTGEMFTTLSGYPGETVHLTQVGDSNRAAGGYPNSWYGRPVRSQDHGCLEVVYSRNKTYLDNSWIQLKLYRHFLKITNDGSLIIINPVHTTQTRCTTPGGLTRLIPGGAIANGVIVNQDGSSSQVIAIEIRDNKPQALLAGGTAIDISSYTISDTVSEEKYFYND